MDIAKAIQELDLALVDLRASASYRQYKANGTLPKTKLGTSEQHMLAASAALVDPVPVPDPTPSAQGAKIDELFPWVRDWAHRPATTTSLGAASGFPASPRVIDAVGQTPGATVLFDGLYRDFVVRGLTNGGGSFDGIKVAGGVDHALVQLLHAYDLSGTKPQGFASQRGISNVALLGAKLERCGTNTLAHGLYWGLVTGPCLVAAVLAHGQHGYGLQFYPGTSTGKVYVTHATLVGSVERNAIVAEATTVEVRNSILGPNAIPGVNLRAGGIVRVYRSCVPGADLSAKNSDGTPVYTDCITNDPDLDPVTFRPRNPAVFGFLGNPDWTPVHDCNGKTYLEPILGAVA